MNNAAHMTVAEADALPCIQRASEMAAELDDAARAFGFGEATRLKLVNQRVLARTGINLLAELGATHLLSEKKTPAELGKPLGLSGITVNWLLRDMGYQSLEHDDNGDPFWAITEAGRLAGGCPEGDEECHIGAIPDPDMALQWPECIGAALIR